MRPELVFALPISTKVVGERANAVASCSHFRESANNWSQGASSATLLRPELQLVHTKHKMLRQAAETGEKYRISDEAEFLDLDLDLGCAETEIDCRRARVDSSKDQARKTKLERP